MNKDYPIQVLNYRPDLLCLIQVHPDLEVEALVSHPTYYQISLPMIVQSWPYKFITNTATCQNHHYLRINYIVQTAREKTVIPTLAKVILVI